MAFVAHLSPGDLAEGFREGEVYRSVSYQAHTGKSISYCTEQWVHWAAIWTHLSVLMLLPLQEVKDAGCHYAPLKEVVLWGRWVLACMWNPWDTGLRISVGSCHAWICSCCCPYKNSKMLNPPMPSQAGCAMRAMSAGRPVRSLDTYLRTCLVKNGVLLGRWALACLQDPWTPAGGHALSSRSWYQGDERWHVCEIPGTPAWGH